LGLGDGLSVFGEQNCPGAGRALIERENVFHSAAIFSKTR
jgi:hypothetical protein